MSETTETMVHDAKYEVTTIDDEASASTKVAELLASVESPEDSALRSSLEIPPSVTEEDQPSFPIPVEDAAPSVDIDHRSEIDGVDINRDLSEIEGVDVLNHKLSDLNGIEIINHKSDLNGVDIINHNLPELDDVNIVNHTSELDGDNPNHNSEPNGININYNNLSELDDADIITHKCKLDFVDTNHKSELDGITNKHDLSELDDVEIVHNNLNELGDDTINHKSELNGVDIRESSSDTVEISQILITESKDLEDKSAEEEEEKPLAEVISTSEDDVREVVEGVPTYANILEVSPGSEEISEAIRVAESSLQEGDMNGIDEEGLTVVPSQQESMVSTEGDVEASSASNSNEEEYVKSRGLHEETVTLVPAIEEDDKSELTEVDTQSTLPRVSSCTISKDEHDMNPNEEEEEEEALTLVPTQQEEASSEVEYVESNGEEVLSAFDPPTQDDTNVNTEGDIDASLPSSAKESLNSIEHYNSKLSKIEDIETGVTESEDDRASTLPVISPSANGLKEAHVNNPNDQEEESPLVQSVKSLGDDIVSTFEDVTGLHQKDSKEETNQCLEESCDEESRSTNTNHEGIPGEDEIPSSVDVPHDDLVSPNPDEIPIEKPLSPENAIETADNQISVLKPEAVLETPTSSTFDLVSPDPHEIPIEKPLSIEEPIENADSQNPMLAYEIDPETPISSTFDLVSPDPHEIPIEKPRSTEEPIENGDRENSMLTSEVVPGTPTNSTIDLVSPTPHEIPIEKPLSPEEPLENAESNQASVLASEIVPETPASTIDAVSPTPREISKGETLSPEGPIENAGNQNSVLAPAIVPETPASTIDSVSVTPHEISKEETLSPEEPIENTGNQNPEVASEIVPETNQNSVVASEIVLETPSSAVEKLCNGSPTLPKACGDASADEGGQELIMMSNAQQEVKEQLVPTIKLEELEEGNLASPDQSTDGPNEDEKLIEQIPFEEEARKFKETKLYGQSSCNSSYFDGYDEIPQQAQGSKVNEIIDENEVEKHVEPDVSSRSFLATSLDGLEEHSRAREDEQIHLGLEECSHEATNGDEGVGPGENGDHILDKEQDYSKTDNNVIGKEKVRFRMKLPLLVTGIAIAAVGVAVASIGRSH